MNLLENSNSSEKYDDPVQNENESLQNEDESLQDAPEKGNLTKWMNKPYMTIVLLVIIVILLLCIVMLLFLPRHEKQEAVDRTEQLEQNITDYAETQKQNAQDRTEGNLVIEKTESEVQEEVQEEPVVSDPAESADADKTAVVVDVEDENDISYTKEYILKEALPYFADNNQDAIWDLAHLKRYVKLSKELEGTGKYYYSGDTDANGVPNGTGLAIYENNSYYYGGWVNGVRSGEGRWFRFYIMQKDKNNAMGKYMAHSYSGTWADDLPNGEGSEHYDVDIARLSMRERIIQNVVGTFKNGLYDGDLFANTVDNNGTQDEWHGHAQNGVFDLWRDMSAIGECSVWQNKSDKNLCLDIDQSENKNQGMRELLK